MRRIVTGLTIVFFLFCVSSPSYASAPKAGDICKKFGASTGSGNKRIVCGYVTQLRWQSSPVKPPLGTIFNPVPAGQSLSTSFFSVKINQIDFGVGSEICSSNPFNQGCKINSNLAGEIDPDSAIRWVSVDLFFANRGKYSLSPAGSNFTYYLVLANNELLENSTTPVFTGNLSSITLSPGNSGGGRIAFAIPRESRDLNPILILRDESQTKIVDYYLLMNW